MNKHIYLCGAITGLTFADAKYGWRQSVELELKNTDIEILSPMRGKMAPRYEGTDAPLSPLGDPDSVLSCDRGITARDRYDVQRSALLFCNLLGMDRISVGSMIEFGWADAARVPILAIMEEGNIHEHGIVNQLISWRCSSLLEGIEVVKSVLKEGL